MKPYKFQPYLKTTIWGGYQIAPFKGIFNAQPNVGESWEISGVPGHESVAINRGLIDDVDEGLTLVQLIDKYKGLPPYKYTPTTSWRWSVTDVPERRRCGTSSRVMWARRFMLV